MASTGYTTYPLKGCPTPGVVFIPGSFLVNGTSAPDGIVGQGFTVAYVSSGVYRVTLSKTYHRCIAVVPGVGESTSTGLFKVNTKEINPAATFSTFDIHTQSTVTDTNTDNQQVSFLCIVADTSIVNERSS